MADDMAWARFTGDHTHRIEHHTSIDYKAGMRLQVTREVLDGAVKAGAAEAIDTPPPKVRERLARDPFAADGPDPALPVE